VSVIARFILLLTPFPALIASLLLMQSAQVGRALLIQQAGVSCVAAILGALALWRNRGRDAHSPSRVWFLAVTLISLLLPLFLSPDAGPRRWLSPGGGFRLYVAALLLPAAILHLASLRAAWLWLVSIGIALALVLQPDASQVTAFALACAVLLYYARRSVATWLTLLALVGGTVVAWWLPDPLKPVPYVEGVLKLAHAAGVLPLMGALLTLALPPGVLLWQSRAFKRHDLFAVAIYYLGIYCLACTQRTPMPFLGFGAGPILGYFLMVSMVSLTPVAEK
jgi:cell division protein FtsW (lipid II flippase)